MKKQNKIILTSIIVILILGSLSAFILLSEPTTESVVPGFTPIYCNDYSFTCCINQVESANTKSISDEIYFQCPLTASKCMIGSHSTSSSLNEEWYTGSVNCRMRSFLWDDYWDCADESTGFQTELEPGEYIWAKVPGSEYATVTGTVNYETYEENLIFTGRAGSTVGVPVSGADGCSFNPSATYKDGKLVDYEISATSYVVSEGDCIQTFVPGDRHICGNIEEQCDSDNDCDGHTYGNQECIGRTLQTYGCTQFGLPYYLETYGSAVAYKPFEGDNDGNEDALSRCEITSSETVQCCGDNDCGSNAFCDKSTWTCQETAPCGQDSDCGVSEQCARDTKELKKPICLSGSCAFDIVQEVECCISEDCPLDYFCDADYTCKESIISKLNCPYECCVGEDSFFEKPCPSDKFCVDNVCQEEVPDVCGCWVGVPFSEKCMIKDLGCLISLWLEKFKLWFAIVFGFLGGILAGSFTHKFTENQEDKKRWTIISIVSIILGLVIGIIAFFYFLWILAGLILFALIKWLVPGV